MAQGVSSTKKLRQNSTVSNRGGKVRPKTELLIRTLTPSLSQEFSLATAFSHSSVESGLGSIQTTKKTPQAGSCSSTLSSYQFQPDQTKAHLVTPTFRHHILDSSRLSDSKQFWVLNSYLLHSGTETLVQSQQDSELPTYGGEVQAKSTACQHKTCLTSLESGKKAQVDQEFQSFPSERARTSAVGASRGIQMALYLVVLLLASGGWLWSMHLEKTVDAGPNSVYIIGGGFSGFWYTLGRLHALQEKSAAPKDYYCYSAGCLGLVAVLLGEAPVMTTVFEMAQDIQVQWKAGQISRYDVVPQFVDRLLREIPYRRNLDAAALENDTDKEKLVDAGKNSTHVYSTVFSHLNIITSARNPKGVGVKAVIQRPLSLVHLRSLLLQTTWIPFAIGKDLWYHDDELHVDSMDGAVSYFQHPKCAATIGLPHNWGLYTNIVNVNLGRDKAFDFYRMGLEHEQTI